MSLKIKLLFVSTISLLLISCSTSTRTGLHDGAGKLYTAVEADELYGNVLDSVVVPESVIKDAFNKTKKHLMFKIKEEKLIILGDERKVIYPEGIIVTKDEVFTVFDLSIIKDLLDKGGKSQIIFENREKVLTVTDGNYTLEWGGGCPPFCG